MKKSFDYLIKNYYDNVHVPSALTVTVTVSEPVPAGENVIA